MKTLLSFAIAIIFSVTTYGQTVVFSSNFENWTDNVPNGWVGTKTSLEMDSIMMVSGGTYGTNLCELTNMENGHKRFTTLGLPVEEGVTYEIEFWVRGNGQIRTAIWDSSYGTYNSYIDIDATTSENHTQTVVADTTFSMAEFIFSVRNTTGDNLQLDSVVIKTGSPVEPTEVTIYDIQFTEDASGDSPYNNEPIETSGIVTAITGNGYFLQDGNGAWNGIFVYDNDNVPSIGDELALAGSVTEYFNLTEITNITSFEVTGTGTIEPSVVTTNDANNEMWEGVLAKVEGATCVTVPDEFGNWTVENGGEVLNVDDMMYEFAPEVGTLYDVTGPITYSYSLFRMNPRDANDVVATPVSVNEIDALNINMYPTPFVNEFTVELNGTYSLDIISMDGKIVSSSQLQNTAIVNTSSLASGMYMIQITQGENSSTTIVEKR